ncbi:LIMR family protein DDB_G0283707 [Durusdinium trenchii]|uniref:LIMR family protein DDB_G0283707 n=1 Tax=Durusdinium trenchii TaxID=1381693 RepID=A0ABP0P9U5_9DINO
MDVFLLIFILAILGLSIVTNTRLLIYYQQPEDAGLNSILCKVIIVSSLTLAWMLNLLLPIDVRNSRPTTGFLDMQALWSAAFITLAVFIVLVVPTAMFYYEVEGDEFVKRKRRYVMCSLLMTLIFSAAILAISFPFLSQAAIPVVSYVCEEWQTGEETGRANVCGDGKAGWMALGGGGFSDLRGLRALLPWVVLPFHFWWNRLECGTTGHDPVLRGSSAAHHGSHLPAEEADGPIGRGSNARRSCRTATTRGRRTPKAKGASAGAAGKLDVSSDRSARITTASSATSYCWRRSSRNCKCPSTKRGKASWWRCSSFAVASSLRFSHWLGSCRSSFVCSCRRSRVRLGRLS